MTSVGFIGLGNIGAPMASWLPKHFDTWVFDLREEATAPLAEAGASVAQSCADLAARCDVIGVCVVDDAGTRAVIAGEGGLLSGARAGTVIAVHGTIRPAVVRELAAEAQEKGVSVIDAQITGGSAGAAAGTLTTMVGGDPAAVEKARPFLESFSSQITRCGDVGAGAIAKICNNVVVYQVYQALTEANDMALAAGIDQQTFAEVLSWMPDRCTSMLPSRNVLLADPEHKLLRPALQAALVLAEKDLSLAQEVAAAGKVAVPGTDVCKGQMRRIYGLPD